MLHVSGFAAILASSKGLLDPPYFVPFGADEATRFWKRGSLRSGSNIGSSRSSAGVSGGFVAKAPSACFRNWRAGRPFRWRGRRRYVLFDQVPKHCREQEGDQLRAPVFQGQSDE